MRTIIAALCMSLCWSTVSFAQCYGDAAQAFGCGGSKTQEATLEAFGNSSRNEIMPDYGYSRPISTADLFSPQQTLGYYRRIYTGWRGNRWAEQTYRDSMNFGARPLRAFGNLPSSRPRF